MEIIPSHNGNFYGVMSDGFSEWLYSLTSEEKHWLMSADDGYSLPCFFDNPKVDKFSLCFPATSRKNQSPRFLLLVEAAYWFERIIDAVDIQQAKSLLQALEALNKSPIVGNSNVLSSQS